MNNIAVAIGQFIARGYAGNYLAHDIHKQFDYIW